MTAEEILIIHLVVIDEEFCDYEVEAKYGNQMRGIKDTNMFNSALYEPKQTFDNIELYPDIISKASCYLRSFAINHPFHDGNKRTALLSTIIFLENNGYKVIATNEQLYKFVEKVVRGRLSIDSIKKRLKKYIKKDVTSKIKEEFSLKEFLKKCLYRFKHK